jgi:hypothetical protein
LNPNCFHPFALNPTALLVPKHNWCKIMTVLASTRATYTTSVIVKSFSALSFAVHADAASPQVYGVNSVGRYKGNETLYENKALLAPKTATSTLDYNATMARFNTPLAADNATAATATPGMPLGNFSIPGFTIENATIPTVSAPGLNLTQGLGFGNLSLPGSLPGDVTAAAEPQPAEPKPKSAAGVAAAGLMGLPLMAAAVLLL